MSFTATAMAPGAVEREAGWRAQGAARGASGGSRYSSFMAVTRLGSSRGSAGQSPLVLGAVTIGLGLTAHLVGGGSAVDCAPLLLAAVIAVVTTLAAQRAVAPAYRGAPIAVGLLGVGQLGMHLALSSHEAADPAATSVLGLSCGWIVTHTVATAVLAVLLLGAHQSAELALHLLSHARERIVMRIVFVAPRDECVDRSPAPEKRHVSRRSQQWRYGTAQSRRGPPALLA